MDKARRRYTLWGLALGAVAVAGGVYSALAPDPLAFACAPLLAVCAAGALWCLLGRLWLCRGEQYLAKTFTRTLGLSLAVPAWLGLTLLFYLLPGNRAALLVGDTYAIAVLWLLAAAVAVPVAAVVLSVLAVRQGIRHMNQAPAGAARAYREGPFALALVLCMVSVGTVLFCGIYMML